jgi:hypothetical protein
MLKALSMLKTIIPLIILLCSACNEQKNDHIPIQKSQTGNMEARIIGVWYSDIDDEVTKNNIGHVTMTFTKEGCLIYDIHEEGKLQRMNMVYRVSGDMIISDQPSHPSEQRTKYKLDGDDKLILNFEGVSTIFRRQK